LFLIKSLDLIRREHLRNCNNNLPEKKKKEKKEKNEKGEKVQKGEKSKGEKQDKQTYHTPSLSKGSKYQEIVIEEGQEKSTRKQGLSASVKPKSKNNLLLDVFSENKENISPDLSLIFPIQPLDPMTDLSLIFPAKPVDPMLDLSLIFPTKPLDPMTSTRNQNHNQHLELAIESTKNNHNNIKEYKENKENINPELTIGSTKIAIKKNTELLLKFKEPELKLDAVQKPSKRSKGMMKI